MKETHTYILVDKPRHLEFEVDRLDGNGDLLAEIRQGFDVARGQLLTAEFDSGN